MGIAAIDGKIVQRAVGWILEAIFEEDFTGFRYGFRLGIGQHHALDAVCVGIEQRPVNWILDADIKAFFDTLDREWLMRFLGHRSADQRMLRLIGNWQGVAQWERSEGSPCQGS